MTQEDSIQSKRQEIWTRLYGLLDLNPGLPAPGGRGRVLMAVRPVVSVEDVLFTPDIRNEVKTQTSALVVYHTVPDDERWLVLGIEASRTGGDRDVTAVNLFEPSNVGGNSMSLVVQAAASSIFKIFEHPIFAYPGWRLRLVGSGGTTNGDWSFNVFTYVSPSWLT